MRSGCSKEQVQAKEIKRLSAEVQNRIRATREVAAVALHHAGHNVGCIAGFLGVTEKSVYRYLGDARIDRRPGQSGRPRKHTEYCKRCGKLSSTQYVVVNEICNRKRCKVK